MSHDPRDNYCDSFPNDCIVISNTMCSRDIRQIYRCNRRSTYCCIIVQYDDNDDGGDDADDDDGGAAARPGCVGG